MYKTKWLGFIDLDEFIVPFKTKTLSAFLRHFEDYPALAIHWIIYGDSGHKTKTKGLVIERFIKHSLPDFEKNDHVKVILNPRKTFVMKIHTGVFIDKKTAVNENFEPTIHSRNKKITMKQIRINHYYGKSFGEYIGKIARGSNAKNEEYARDKFNIHNKNDLTDSCMKKYIAPIKKNLKKRGLLDI